MRLVCQECEREYELDEVPETYPCGHIRPDEPVSQSGVVLDEMLALYGSLGYTEDEALLLILESQSNGLR